MHRDRVAALQRHLHLWSLSSNRSMKAAKNCVNHKITSLRYSPDSHIVSGSPINHWLWCQYWECATEAWHLYKGKLPRERPTPNPSIYPVRLAFAKKFKPITYEATRIIHCSTTHRFFDDGFFLIQFLRSSHLKVACVKLFWMDGIVIRSFRSSHTKWGGGCKYWFFYIIKVGEDEIADIDACQSSFLAWLWCNEYASGQLYVDMLLKLTYLRNNHNWLTQSLCTHASSRLNILVGFILLSPKQ